RAMAIRFPSGLTAALAVRHFVSETKVCCLFVAKSKCTRRWPSLSAVYMNPLESGSQVICGTQPAHEMKAKEMIDAHILGELFITEFRKSALSGHLKPPVT